LFCLLIDCFFCSVLDHMQFFLLVFGKERWRNRQEVNYIWVFFFFKFLCSVFIVLFVHLISFVALLFHYILFIFFVVYCLLLFHLLFLIFFVNFFFLFFSFSYFFSFSFVSWFGWFRKRSKNTNYRSTVLFSFCLTFACVFFCCFFSYVSVLI
jgi:hypothetical protein